jgi:hypothetical protein
MIYRKYQKMTFQKSPSPVPVGRLPRHAKLFYYGTSSTLPSQAKRSYGLLILSPTTLYRVTLGISEQQEMDIYRNDFDA